MQTSLTIYHGSKEIIEKPQYGIGKINNDYGRGFYCTEYIELAKEWACSETSDGYANCYSLNTKGLDVLNLNSNEYTIVDWITLLIKNRRFSVSSPIANQAVDYLTKYFDIDTTSYDIIQGYRADDSYFSFARGFLQNTISVRQLGEIMKLGNLGNQIVLISQEAFSRIDFKGYERVQKEVYYPLRKKRDENARNAYKNSLSNEVFRKDDILIMDILREEMKRDDPRLQRIIPG